MNVCVTFQHENSFHFLGINTQDGNFWIYNQKLSSSSVLKEPLSKIVVVQELSHVQLFSTPWIAAHQALFSTISWSLLKFTSIESMMLSNHLIPRCPILLLPSVFPSIRVFSNKLTIRIRQPQYWSFSISHSNEYSGLISFRIDWFDILAVQETLQHLLQD